MNLSNGINKVIGKLKERIKYYYNDEVLELIELNLEFAKKLREEASKSLQSSG